MNLADFALEPRRRAPFEAADLAIVLCRSSLPQLAAAACLAFAPPLALIVLFAREDPIIAQLILWWCKPWYDRCYLGVLSRRVFGGEPNFNAQLGALKSYLHGLLAALTVYRLDPARSYNLPVWQLERMAGRERWRRARVLQRGVRGHASALTLACVHFEAVLYFGVFALAWWLAPEGIEVDVFAFVESEEGWMAWTGVLVYAALVNVVEPLYVASGFSLYLNRRVELEGWDIEIRFRRMARRLAPKLARSLTAGCVLLLVAYGPGALPAEVDKEAARAAVEEVYAMDEFGTEEVVTRWRWRDATSGEPDEEAWRDYAADLGGEVATGFKILVIIVVGGLIIWVARNRDWQAWGRGPRRARAASPDTVAGLDIRRRSLPKDIAAAARGALEDGRVADALSLLYRGTLAQFVADETVAVRESDTEGDCLRRSRSALDEQSYGFFRDLTQAWLACAYGAGVAVDVVAKLIGDFEGSATS